MFIYSKKSNGDCERCFIKKIKKLSIACEYQKLMKDQTGDDCDYGKSHIFVIGDKMTIYVLKDDRTGELVSYTDLESFHNSNQGKLFIENHDHCGKKLINKIIARNGSCSFSSGEFTKEVTHTLRKMNLIENKGK